MTVRSDKNGMRQPAGLAIYKFCEEPVSSPAHSTAAFLDEASGIWHQTVVVEVTNIMVRPTGCRHCFQLHRQALYRFLNIPGLESRQPYGFFIFTLYADNQQQRVPVTRRTSATNRCRCCRPDLDALQDSNSATVRICWRSVWFDLLVSSRPSARIAVCCWRRRHHEICR